MADEQYTYASSEGVLVRRPVAGSSGFPEVWAPRSKQWRRYVDDDVIVAPEISVERAVEMAGSRENLSLPCADAAG